MYTQCLSLRGAPPQVPTLSIPQTGTGHDKWRVFVYVMMLKVFILFFCLMDFLFQESMQKGPWSSDVYNIIGVVFCSRSYNVTCFFERSASTSAHSVNTTDRQRPWQWRVFVCVCACLSSCWKCFFVLLNLEFLFEKSMQNNDLLVWNSNYCCLGDFRWCNSCP